MATILITGTSQGIGLETAVMLARAGHTVYATMRNPAKASELTRRASKERLPIQISTLDVTNDESVATAIRAIERSSGGIDVLVNNAGIESHGSIEETPFDVVRTVMDTNYLGAVRCIQAVLPAMRARRKGCIINLSSVAGRIACSPLGAYSASKYALEALSEALAQEVKPFNIRVAIVQPAITDTAMARSIGESAGQSVYPHARRMAGLFYAALENPVPATVVAEKIREIIESGTWTLRHPAGPGALPFLQWRAAMNDEQWVDWNAANDEVWFQSVQRDFGLDARRGAGAKNTTPAQREPATV